MSDLTSDCEVGPSDTALIHVQFRRTLYLHRVRMAAKRIYDSMMMIYHLVNVNSQGHRRHANLIISHRLSSQSVHDPFNPFVCKLMIWEMIQKGNILVIKNQCGRHFAEWCCDD